MRLKINMDKIGVMKEGIQWKSDKDRDKVNIEGRDQVLGYRRSGNHLLIETLQANFKERFAKGHRPANIRRFKNGNEVYIIRDIRDVLCSCYRWWTLSGESKVSGIRNEFQEYDFEDYVKGKIEITEFIDMDGKGGVGKWDMDRGLISDPIGSWLVHVDSYEKEGIPIIRFEDLKKEPEMVVRRLWRELDLTPTIDINQRVRKVERYVGYMPHKGESGTWKEYFTDDLEKYLWRRAKKVMMRYGYLLEAEAKV